MLKLILKITCLMLVFTQAAYTEDSSVVIEAPVVVIEEEVPNPEANIEIVPTSYTSESGDVYSAVEAIRVRDGKTVKFVLVTGMSTFDDAFGACESFGDVWRLSNERDIFAAQITGIYEALEPKYLGYYLGPSGYGSEDGGIIISEAGGTITASWFVDALGYSASDLTGTDNVVVYKGWSEEVVGLQALIKRLEDFAENPEHPVYKEYYEVAAEKLGEGVDALCLDGDLLD